MHDAYLLIHLSEYYDAFVSIRRGLFNTRDRAEHTRKRKIVSHTFSAKSIGQFEQYIHANLELFLQKWTRLSKEAQANKAKTGGYASIDSLHWFNYLAFDIIGDLAFGQPFGMLERERDFAEIRKSPDAPPQTAPAIQVLNRRGEVSGTLGCLPACDRYFRDTVYTDACRSWYRSDGGRGPRITGLWPGSTLHALEALRAPRWEDYDWEPAAGAAPDANRLAWLGNGSSLANLRDEATGAFRGDPAWYLEPRFQDVPMPGRPEDDPAYRARCFSA